MSDFLKADAIMGMDDRVYEDVVVPEWGGGKVRVVGLDANASSKFGKRMVKVGSDGKLQTTMPDNFMAELVALSLTDENFIPLFSHADVNALGKKSAKVVKRLYEVAARLSGLGEDAEADAAKNSDGIPAEDSQ